MQKNINGTNNMNSDLTIDQICISEAKYKSVFDIAGDAMFLIEQNTGNILEANQTAVKVYGYNKNEFLLLKNTDLSAEPEKTADALKSELQIAPIRYHRKKDGTVFPVEITATYFDFEDKRVSVVNIRDISLRLIDKQLLEDKNKEMEQLIYITSHDFRSPLLNIIGFNSELKNIFQKIKSACNDGQNPEKLIMIKKYFDEEIPDAFQYIDLSCTKMNNLIEALLKISRISRVELCYQKINMTEFCSVIASVNNFLLKEKNISVEISPLPECTADRNLMNQVFANLFTNSIKFMKSNTNGLIKISGSEVRDKVIYCFEDNGIGVPIGKEKTIFEMFNKLNAEVTGEGMGLTIAWKIINKHRGKIWLESEEGKGSRFYIELPK